MATIPRSIKPVAEREEETIPPLEPGDHLDQQTFHERYEAMPDNTRAELIGGVVFMSSPAKPRHGRKHGKVIGWLSFYEAHTPGVEMYADTSAILGTDSEPQPDAGLLIAPEKGGQTRVNEDGWLEGAPELIGEIAVSTESYDLYEKKRDYERAGVKEYIAVALRQRKVFWFILRQGKFEELSPGADGILRSETFPGLWLDPDALLRDDSKRVLEVLEKGLASPDHAAFRAKLAERTDHASG